MNNESREGPHGDAISLGFLGPFRFGASSGLTVGSWEHDLESQKG
jgi:hypothetical protein